MKDKRINFKDLSLKKMEELLISMGEKPFRAKQIFSWIYKDVESIGEMVNLPLLLRNRLDKIGKISRSTLVSKKISAVDGTAKFLFELEDGARIETVYMEYNHGNTLCISSQAGCRMGCSFCASTKEGLYRNLTPGEMLNQIFGVESEMGKKMNNIVIMGTGEPFDNYDNLSVFLRNINEKIGRNLGYRHITVSTCGIVPGIKSFSRDFPQVNLAVSLHSAEDKIRSEIMDVNTAYPLEELISACKDYICTTGRRITFEYILLEGINDGYEDINHLSELLKNINCHVNFIPFNKVEDRVLKATSRKKGREFVDYLEKKGIRATLRRELGSDIDGACGQLRLNRKYNSKYNIKND